MENIKQSYLSRLETLKKQLSLYKKRRKKLGGARLVTFVAAILLFFIFLTINGWVASILAIVLLCGFIIATLKDLDNAKKLHFVEQLIQINTEELEALDGNYKAFGSGAVFKEDKHPYTGDLDIFGSHSIFRMLNRTTTFRSAQRLASWLKNPTDKKEIIQRQEAVKALASEVEWRQELRAVGRHENIHESDFDQILEWAKSHPETENLKKWNLLTRAAMIMTGIFILLGALHLASWQLLWISLIVHSWIVWKSGKVLLPHYELLSKTAHSLEALEQRLFLIGTKDFDNEHLQALQTGLETESKHGEQKAYQAIQSLKKILERLDIRNNPLVHFPLNWVVFWDWHQFRQLTKMHQKIHESLLRWADIFVEVEVLCSVANLTYNQPHWEFPEITEEYFTLEATALGHPLILSGKRVCNDVTLEGKGKMMLITGSNMAGKSTFLRSIGVNVVLAMIGSPVCAEKMVLSPANVISSMRIADNLEENISTFYAELQKLEYIIKQAKKRGRNLLLMDEILRGTNSNDRHSGSRALIEQLLAVDAVGILATHDLALTDLEEKYPKNVDNYHFDVQVQNEDLFFDYVLKKGICTSMNASILMRKIGIEV